MSGVMRKILLLAFSFSGFVATSPALLAADVESGFTSLMDGKSFEGWKKAEESPETWTVEDGAFVAHGNRCHLFYVGDQQPFKNFHLKVEVFTAPGSNGGIYFHT